MMKKNEKEQTGQSNESFGRFEELAKRLAAVPKSELDEKLAEYEEKKQARKAKRVSKK